MEQNDSKTLVRVQVDISGWLEKKNKFAANNSAIFLLSAEL